MYKNKPVIFAYGYKKCNMEGQDTDKEKKSTRGVCPKGTRYGGRTKGTPNKVSGELRKRIASFLEERWDEAVNEWENIKEPKDKVKLYIELMAYVMPKLQSVTLEGSLNTSSSVEEDLKKLANDKE